MKFSESWLREWVNPEWETNALAEALSLAGLEVDGVNPVAPAFNNVVVGYVESIEKHPDADKLNVTQVNVGDDELVQIVCGAKNVAAGQKVCCAKVGAVLPGDFKIKKAKLRGVPSHGMLCGATEIGLPDDGVDGLHLLPEDAPIGTNLRDYLNLDDHIIEVDLTPNRADCFSVLGVARDVAAISGEALTQPFESLVVPKSGVCPQAIRVEASTACPKYLGCMVTDFDASATTPSWMAQRLERSGLSPKSLLVDITNYVLLELGQPMHAFDADKLQGDVVVRLAKDSETLITLEEKEITLTADTLVIADDQGPIALAGIMGGLPTAVSDGTTRAFFECAHFAPLSLAGKARQYGLHTDSSMRFERGVDAALPEVALERALALLTDIAGGQVSDVVAVVNESALPQAQTISLRPERIRKLLGVDIADETVEAIFNRLNFAMEKQADGWLLTAPSYRFDMAIEADLIEEVGRVYGYNNLPETPLEAPMRLPSLPEAEQELYLLKQALVQRGYQEAVTYSFVAEDKQNLITPEMPSICLQNPISEDMKAMRTSLFPGLLSTLSYNQKRQQSRVRLFESGLVFQSIDGETAQIPMLGGVIVGLANAESWAQESRAVDFYDLKADVESLLAMSHLQDKVTYARADQAAFHPGQSAQIQLDGRTIGVFGQLHPSLVKPMGVNGKVFMFQMELEALSLKSVPQAQAISKFPEVQRDLAFVVARDLPMQDLMQAVKSVDCAFLQGVSLFDLYQGEGMADDQKSLALTLRLQHADRTLEDEEVDAYISQVIAEAEAQVAAALR